MADILFRCSRLGQLMTEPKSKSETLSETTKTYLEEVYLYEKYGRKKDFSNKYIQKGNLSEDDSVTLYSRVTKQLFFKNEDHISNEWIIGTPDLYVGDELTKADEIIDLKTSWDIFTFYKSKREGINKDYYWQLQGYMYLTNAKHSKLAYCLVNTPETIINDEKRKFMWKANFIDENAITDEVFAEIERCSLYDDIPMEDRVHIINIDYNQEDIDRLKLRIVQCREYIKETFKFVKL